MVQVRVLYLCRSGLVSVDRRRFKISEQTEGVFYGKRECQYGFSTSCEDSIFGMGVALEKEGL